MIWRYTLPQVMKLIGSRNRRIERHNREMSQGNSTSDNSWVEEAKLKRPPTLDELQDGFAGLF